MPQLHLLVPGDPRTPTGGYIYDREVLEGLRHLGWSTHVHSLDTSFPQPTPSALRAARAQLDALPPRSLVVIDGLALAGLEHVLEEIGARHSVVALIHHPLAFETGLDADVADRLRASERRALQNAARVIVTSRWTAGALRDYGVSPERIRVVEPGVHAPAATRNDETRRGPPSLLCVATITPRKGHALLVEALGELRDRPWHLTCVGSLTRDPACVQTLRRQIERLRLEQRISLLGEVDDSALERHYAHADLFVLPSHLEGYGMALAEALVRGIPVVSTTAGAIPSTVPTAAGVLVPPGDAPALTRALASLLDAPEKRAALASVARSLPRRSWHDAANDFAAAVEDLAA